MRIRTTALIAATLVAVSLNASDSREAQRAFVPHLSADFTSTHPIVQEPALTFDAEASLLETTHGGQCSEFSWAFNSAEAKPPSVELEDGELGQHFAIVRM